VHPGNDAHALVGRAGLDARRENRLGVLDDRLPNHTNGNRLGFVKPGRDSLRVRGDLLQHRLAVQVLATCEKPDLEFAQRLQYDDSQFCAGVPPAESVDERRPTTGCTPPPIRAGAFFPVFTGSAGPDMHRRVEGSRYAATRSALRQSLRQPFGGLTRNALPFGLNLLAGTPAVRLRSLCARNCRLGQLMITFPGTVPGTVTG